ncbi:hypothetical protein CARUB_v10024252mg [Capsella rubella]|uniref:RING-type E3 ubiquitin transferase n=1 Tax=Capsella rubella TaxID=81985 RepID=R0HRX2_9BRAS|nr:RING-H2 finger protein ATL40 [Capsella rubella]EOA28070.1 hypothetical protein CARUB_v10024252mg [Capsella rubella]
MGFNDPSLNTIILWFAAVTSLVTISVIFALLVLCLLKRRRFDVSPEEENEYHGRSEPPCQGLSASVIAAFPTFSYKPDNNNDLESNNQEIECPVCLGLIPKNVVIKVLPNCMHMFDEECIGKWLESHATCPVCRTLAQPMASSGDKVLEKV